MVQPNQPASESRIAPATSRDGRVRLSAAAQKRTESAAQAGVLDLALGAAVSIQPRDAIEAMLVDQLAVGHNAAMRLSTQASIAPNAVDMVRLANASARMMEVFQQGALALHRLCTGGRQTVVVQHVQVADGGQAVVAGNLEAANRGADGTEGE
ncbi:MAG TPA: hypothetical protein VLE03_01265 [Nitrospiraceae bacterium]|nr:hypothetical protein [Nitrospiraceae bacterium]